MSRRALTVLCALIVLLGLAACQKLDAPEGELPRAGAAFLDAVPAEYGALVAVTSHAGRPDIAQLWFRKDDGSIVVVYVDFVEGRILDRVLTIPRR